MPPVNTSHHFLYQYFIDSKIQNLIERNAFQNISGIKELFNKNLLQNQQNVFR